jgi:hypothetical protein
MKGVHAHDRKLVGEAMKHHKNMVNAHQIQHNLHQMSKWRWFNNGSIDVILKREDEGNREMKTVGEALEYMLKSKVIEVLCAYAMSDRPGGFFKIGLETLSEMLSGVRSISILSNSAVHPGLNSLLRCIY